jgi:diphosphoinositol-polyphosphate diphosphatase
MSIACPISRRQPSRDDEYDVLPFDNENHENEGNSSNIPPPSASSSSPPFTQPPTSCHVRVRSSAPDATPPPGALTGRTHQKYDGERRLVCGCVPFRVDEYTPSNQDNSTSTSSTTAAAGSNSIESSARTGVILSVLLVRSKKRDEWIFAKGGHEEFESRSECAVRELREEGGVEGVLLAALPHVDFASKKQKLSRLYCYLMQVTTSHARWAEQETRRRRWVPLDDVLNTLGREETRKVWTYAMEQLKQLGFIDAQGKAVFKSPPAEEEAKRIRAELDADEKK